VVRAINYYNSPGWGAPITADAGYRGKLTNINLGGDIGCCTHSGLLLAPTRKCRRLPFMTAIE
jgi:hypothetical protein